MSIFTRLRQRLFPFDEPDTTKRERDAAQAYSEATLQNQRAIELMSHWDAERAEDLRRLNITGNLLEGALRPERRRDQA
jgi:hypothetical protein